MLDPDETLVHLSIRAVPGADPVIPVQIKDVVIYVAKRPSINDFLLEMFRHYKILSIPPASTSTPTSSLTRTASFYKGNYVKDLSLLNHDLVNVVNINNSPVSYPFHPENAINCALFINDVGNWELDHIGKFLIGVKEADNVRRAVNLWRHWPNVDLTKNHRRIR